MLDPIKQAIVYDYNAIYYGYPMKRLMERAGKGIADLIVKKYGKGKRIGFFCGSGNNGGDGFVAARYLSKNSKPEVYLIGDSKNIRTPEAKKNWQRFKGAKFENIKAPDIPDNFDVVAECLFGTGIEGKVKEPHASVIKKLNRLKGKKIAVDYPAPSFKPDFVISMMTQKVPGAARFAAKRAVVDIGHPKWLKEKIGVGEVKILHKPSKKSHKGDNGKLLIIGGSKMFHGAPLLAAKIASKIVDLVYFSSILENNELIKRMKSKLCEFITVPRDEVVNFVNAELSRSIDTILIGPGMGISEETRTITNQLLKRFKNKRFVLDADALKVVDKKLLNKNCIITPHREEFKRLFGLAASKKAVFKMARKYKCIIVLKGAKDYVSDGNELKVNTTGNVGMTKGGTGDVLAGLIAALACKNDLFLAASAGAFINGLAGDRLKKKSSYYYNASDLIDEIPKTIKWCLE